MPLLVASVLQFVFVVPLVVVAVQRQQRPFGPLLVAFVARSVAALQPASAVQFFVALQLVSGAQFASAVPVFVAREG